MVVNVIHEIIASPSIASEVNVPSYSAAANAGRIADSQGRGGNGTTAPFNFFACARSMLEQQTVTELDKRYSRALYGGCYEARFGNEPLEALISATALSQAAILSGPAGCVSSIPVSFRPEDLAIVTKMPRALSRSRPAR